MKKFALLVCLVFGLPAARADEVWVPPKGSVHAAISFTGSLWDQYLEYGSSSVALPGEITQYEVAIYGEYAPIENLSFDLLLPFVQVQRKFSYLQTDEFGNILDVGTGPDGEIRDVNTNRGVGDVVLGSKYIFWSKGISLGGRVHLKIPGTYDTGYVPNAPGDGQADLGFSFLAGSNIPQIRMYFRGSFGYVARFGEPGNQIELMLEPGVYITRSLVARFTYQHVHEFGGTDIVPYQENFYPSVKENSDRIGFGLSYRASDTIGFFALYQQTVAGRNTANTKALTFGTDFSF
ncbi:MAG: transporter [Pseudomonadota bacterium]